ncbi:adenosylmethionine--8-amino-7-oxononanoate transaminase [Echinimonas agarilytica]|uniref:Adenosylmethionine-8-amino-7-oxononanoate aminotransferase n=1 Tax=Echinimonas agarilytica TaxID=1215918 RepID=A0AA42B859_9GAMM|nr:adenosylmethionine--8-amino-7-oxononanoate transaminase [Echinimonas agarilytica]MCM2680632.1 adenosylmethionine--8-amino-7-oxononanoate transaminase [Echinimonas agarilytica]
MTKSIDTDFDQRHIWHPYTRANPTSANYAVSHASGHSVTFDTGCTVVDGMASWWSAIHGYQVPEINTAIQSQIGQMSHFMFGGVTHQPAVSLCKKLVDITPHSLQRVFLSDSGSVSVEVAMKMALQYWQGARQPCKTKFMTVRNGYHGDTFAAMSVCDPVNGMHSLFSEVLAQALFLPAPPAGFDSPIDHQWVAEAEEAFALHHQSLAAFIIEPVVQGAGGMRFYAPHYLSEIRRLCDEYGVLLIADEIATGFGRTGKMFAVEHAAITPDIMCLGKALTGGTLSLAATLCTNDVAETVCQSAAGVFMHGPTFMGNPLACAVANASIELLMAYDWKFEVERINKQLSTQLAQCATLNSVRDVRVLGAIGVVETHSPIDVLSLQAAVIAHGAWIRPFGKLAYVMPGYRMTNTELTTLTSAIYKGLLECEQSEV